MDKIEQLYKLYIDSGILTEATSIDDFKSANADQQSQLYDLASDKGLFSTTDLDTFKTAWSLTDEDLLDIAFGEEDDEAVPTKVDYEKDVLETPFEKDKEHYETKDIFLGYKVGKQQEELKELEDKIDISKSLYEDQDPLINDIFKDESEGELAGVAGLTNADFKEIKNELSKEDLFEDIVKTKVTSTPDGPMVTRYYEESKYKPYLEQAENILKLESQKYNITEPTEEQIKNKALGLIEAEMISEKRANKWEDYIEGEEEISNKEIQSLKDQAKQNKKLSELKINILQNQNSKIINEVDLNLANTKTSWALNILNEFLENPTQQFEISEGEEAYQMKDGRFVPKNIFDEAMKQQDNLLSYFSEVESNNKKIDDLVDKLEDENEVLDIVKRDYNDLRKFGVNLGLNSLDLLASTAYGINKLVRIPGAIAAKATGENLGIDPIDDAYLAFTNWKYEVADGFQKDVQFDKIDSWSDAGKWATQSASQQIPIIISMLATGGVSGAAAKAAGVTGKALIRTQNISSSAMIGLSSMGGKMNEMNYEEFIENKKKYSDIEKLLKGIGYGITEGTFSYLSTAPILNRGLNKIRGSKTPIATSATQQLYSGGKEYFKNALRKDILRETLSETFFEGMTTGTQNLIDGKPFFENMNETLVSGGMWGFGMSALPSMYVAGTRNFTNDRALKTIQDKQKSINELLKTNAKLIDQKAKGNLITATRDIDAELNENFNLIRLYEAEIAEAQSEVENNLTNKGIYSTPAKQFISSLSELANLRNKAAKISIDKNKTKEQKQKEIDEISSIYEKVQMHMNIVTDPKTFGSLWGALGAEAAWSRPNSKARKKYNEIKAQAVINIRQQKESPFYDPSKSEINEEADNILLDQKRDDQIKLDKKQAKKLNINFKDFNTRDEAIEFVDNEYNNLIESKGAETSEGKSLLKEKDTIINKIKSKSLNGASIQNEINTDFVVRENMKYNRRFTSGLHENTHRISKELLSANPEAFEDLGRQIIAYLSFTGQDAVLVRMNVFNANIQASGKYDYDEVVSSFMEEIAEDRVDLNKMDNFTGLLGQLFNRGLENATKGDYNIEFKGQDAILSYFSEFGKKLKEGEITVEDIEAIKEKVGVKKPTAKEKVAKLSETASNKVQEIYNNQGTAGALDIIQEFKPIVNRIVDRRREAPGFDRQLLTDEIETGERGILDLIQAYDPESGVPLAAYINKFLPARAIEASQRVLGEVFESDIAERVDIAEPTTEVEEIEITEKPKAPTNLRRALDIKEGSDLYNKVKDVVAKTFGTRIPEVTDPKFKKTLQDTYATELTNDVKELMGKPSSDKYKTFLQKYGEQIYDLIPQDILNKSYQDFIIEEKKNLSPTEVDDAISKGLLPSDTPRTAGPSLFSKKPYNQEEFVEFHLAPKKGRPASKQTQLAQTIAKELGKDATLEVLEDPKVFERFTEVQEIEGKKVTKETKPKVAEKIQREPDFKFSETIEKVSSKDLLNIIDSNLKPLTRRDNKFVLSPEQIEARNNWLKSIAPSFGKDFFTSGNFAFSTRALFQGGMPEVLEVLKDVDFNEKAPKQPTRFIYNKDKFLKDKVKVKINGVTKTISLSEYIKTKEFKDNESKKLPFLKYVYSVIQKDVKNNPQHAIFWEALVNTATNSQGHFNRAMAPIAFIVNPNFKGKIVEEHSLPQVLVGKFLLKAAFEGNLDNKFKLIEDNYFQGALKEVDDNKLKDIDGSITGNKYNYQQSMPSFHDLSMQTWIRYINSNVNNNNGGINTNDYILVKTGKTLADSFNVNLTDSQIQEIGGKARLNNIMPDIVNIQNNIIEQFLLGKIDSKLAKDLLSNYIKSNKQLPSVKKQNISQMTNSVFKPSETFSNQDIIGYAKTIDDALSNARKLDAPVKKIRVFDFDDTLAETKSLVFYNKPSDTKTVKPKLKAIVMAGPPGGGKSSIIKGLGLVSDGFKEVNQDISLEWLKTKEGLPAKEADYTKEQKSMRSKLGAQARKIAARKLDKFSKQGDGIILDGTGASVAATEAKIQALEELGYEVSMIYVNTPKETAIARNKARKERSLPNFIVERTWDAVNANRDVYAGRLGDKFYEVNTESLKQGEVPQEVSDAIRSDLAAEERGRLTAEEFAKQGKDLVDQGFVMDFSDFNIIREGERGPLFEVAKKIKEARGNEDLFVLTARAPESQDAIYEFLKSEGLEFKRENIIGLGNSTGAAKANWIVDKAAEGYNDFYFADDAYANVQAVQDALDQIDVKSKVQQAKVKFSESINKDFNKIIEQTTGIASEKRYSKAKAKVRGAGKGNKKFFIPYSAEDFMGLIYPLLSKGTLGDSQMAWFKEHILDPYGRAIENLSSDRIQMMQDFKELKKSLEVPKDLRKKTESGFTNEQAVRVYLFNKVGHDVPGLSETDLKELIDIVNSDGKLKAFADQILSVTKGDGYVKPAQEWLAGTITTDLIDLLNTTKRKKYLEQSGYLDNVNEVFSEENLNKLEAAYGAKYREAMENILSRMKSGKNRMFSGSRLSNRVLDYINGSIGTIMFFNTRSAVLQTISAVNFLNWSFNNPYKAGKAFANQKQYWKDFKTLMNSDYLTDRRNGLKLNISENEIANAAATAKNKARGAMNYILQKGYLPTQFADSFAIASGGATFYRNRINDLIKQGVDVKQAEEQALAEWRETAEISQQSSDPSKISQQQASNLGRVILAFANTPMQYARIQKRAIQDLANRRGDAKTNVSKIIYYGVVQNLIFNALQQALFGLGFGDDEDDDKKQEKYIDTANGMLDSTLRGLGIAGATTAVIKNFLLDIYERSGRKRPEYVDAVYKLLALSPPISSKISKVRQAAYQFDSKKRRQEIFDKGFSIDNPAYEAGAKVISATTNLPLDRVLNKVNNIEAALGEDPEVWQRVAMLAGWPEWQIVPRDSYKSEKELPKYPSKKINYKKTKYKYDKYKKY